MELNIEDFQTWLESKPNDSKVGITAVCGSCPIAKWLVSMGYYSVSVGIEDIYLDSFRIPTPEWASTFICEVDAIGTKMARLGFTEHVTVTAGQALQIIARIKTS